MKQLILNMSNRQKVLTLPSNLRTLVRRCCCAVLQNEGFSETAEVSVTFVDNDTIRELNRLHRDIDSPTDVLSFPLGEGGAYDINPDNGAKLLGDIVISVPRALDQAQEYDHPFTREIGFLTVHSMLHLLGYDHIEESDGNVMRQQEKIILAGLDLNRDKPFDAEELK